MNSVQERIYRYLVNGLLGGKVAVHEKLPTERALSRRFRTSRMNAHYAIKQLERRGIVKSNRKQGTRLARAISAHLERQLKGETVKRICAIHSKNLSEYLHWNSAFLSGLKPELAGAGYSLESASINNLATRQQLREKMKRLADTGMSAFVFSVRGQEDQLVYQNTDILFQYHRHIFVYQSGALNWKDWPFHTITVNFFGEGRIAVEFLAGKGCANIAYCENEDMRDLEWNRERYKGACFGMQRATNGKSMPENWVGLDDIYNHFLKNGKKHALIAAHDPFAAKIIEYFAERGLAAGKDYRILGMDNDRRLKKYRLTTIAPPHCEIGKQLGRMILSTIAIKSTTNTTVYLKVDSNVIERDTA